MKLELTNIERNVLMIAIQSQKETLEGVVNFGDVSCEDEQTNKAFLEAVISIEKKIWKQDHVS